MPASFNSKQSVDSFAFDDDNYKNGGESFSRDKSMI